MATSAAGRLARTPRGPLRWSRAFAFAAGALWLPFVVALLLNHQVRKSWMDLWFWPGLLPGRYFVDDLYDESFVVFALGNVLVWALVSRRWPLLGVAGALLHGTFSALYLCALAAM